MKGRGEEGRENILFIEEEGRGRRVWEEKIKKRKIKKRKKGKEKKVSFDLIWFYVFFWFFDFMIFFDFL